MKLPSYSFLIPAALLLGLAPFAPEPHLLEKLRWLFTGHPFKPIDIFDLFLHGTLPALLVVKAAGDMVGRRTGRTPGGGQSDGTPTASDPPGRGARRRREERGRGGR